MVTLKNIEKNGIKVSDLECGQVAVIIEWGAHNDIVGRIIQRYGDSLVSLGRKIGNSWTTIPAGEAFRVRVLENGTELLITHNE